MVYPRTINDIIEEYGKLPVLVTGSRNWTDRERVRTVLSLTDPGLLIHGACQGLDLIAASVAAELGWVVIPFRALWEVRGRSAGPVRNTEMVMAFTGTTVLAFHENLLESRGTKHCVEVAIRKGKIVELYDSETSYSLVHFDHYKKYLERRKDGCRLTHSRV